MKSKINLTIFCLLLAFVSNTYAILDFPRLPPDGLIDSGSAEGIAMLKKNANANTMKLLSNFTTQELPAYCGVASSVVVLNAIGKNLPPAPEHPKFPANSADPYHGYFNQKNFFNREVTRIVTPHVASSKGIMLGQLHTIFKESYGFKNTQIYYASSLDVDSFRSVLINAISNGHFIIINFLRAGLDQGIGAHFSPLAAYDRETDRFLMLDVARYKYPAFWVKTKDLYKAANTEDKDARLSRGFIDIAP